MSIVFLIPTPPPVLPEAEAYAQEIGALRRRFGGRVVYINPNRFLPRHLPVQLPRPLFGWHLIPGLWLAGRSHAIYQIYSPTLYAYPLLSALRRPVVFNLTGQLGEASVPAECFRRLAAITVPDPASLARLREAGLDNVYQVRAGIDTRKFHPRPQALDDEIHLLSASAPWTHEQFHSKGVDALLDAALREPRLHLTLLWRGVLTREVHRRVDDKGLRDRVRIVDQLVDVDQELAQAHATVNLATRGDIVKAFPHSLMESVAAGKPVLVSRAIPMAEPVATRGYGVVVEEVTADAVLAAVRRLETDYAGLTQRAAALGHDDYSLDGMLESFEAVYRQIPSWVARSTRAPALATPGSKGE
ncbi:MAG: glycosyltransferase [Acidobacteriota bacterium]